MKYKQIILEKINAHNEQAFIDWIKTYPELEQLEIMKEFNQMAVHDMFKRQDFDNIKAVKEYKKSIEAFEKAILLEQEIIETRNKFLKEKNELIEQLARSSTAYKQLMIDAIINNIDIAELVKVVVIDVIAKEKELGIYDATFWKAIE